MENPPVSVTGFLEEIRAIAQTGMHYTKDPYDQERYERLFDLSCVQYENLTGLPSDEVKGRFRKDVGSITPKTAASAAIFSDDGRILLIRRTDNGLWGLPGGFAEVYEGPEDCAVREVWEETGLRVVAESLIGVFHKPAGSYGIPHTTYSMLYHCTVTEGEATSSLEASEVGYFKPEEIPESDWFLDFDTRARAATSYWEDSCTDGKTKRGD